MANSGANTNGSQFFLVFKDTSLSPSLHALRDDYLGVGYPPESSQCRYFVYSLGRRRRSQGESRYQQRDYQADLSNASPRAFRYAAAHQPGGSP